MPLVKVVGYPQGDPFGCPQKGMKYLQNPMTWGWDLDHESFEFWEGSGFVGFIHSQGAIYVVEDYVASGYLAFETWGWGEEVMIRWAEGEKGYVGVTRICVVNIHKSNSARVYSIWIHLKLVILIKDEEHWHWSHLVMWCVTLPY